MEALPLVSLQGLLIAKGISGLTVNVTPKERFAIHVGQVGIVQAFTDHLYEILQWVDLLTAGSTHLL
jgi:hypothetical protein